MPTEPKVPGDNTTFPSSSQLLPPAASWYGNNITIQIRPTAVIAWDMREADRQVFGGTFENNPGYLLPLER